MNNINLIGRLTADPVLKYSKTGTTFCNFSLAVSHNAEETDFINCTAFNIIAENICKYISKGQLLAVSGELRQGSYEKDSKKVTYYYVMCGKITFIEKKQSDGNNKKGQSKSKKDDFVNIPDDITDSLPFQ